MTSINRCVQAELSLADKVAFLARRESYGGLAEPVALRETHMSWVFLSGHRVYKLKKPVRTSYLNFSSLQRREAACREELRLNRRLAEDVYLGVVPLVARDGQLALEGPGRIVDWLVVMRRLDERQMLEQRIADGRLGRAEMDRVAALLATFYRRARRVGLSLDALLARWRGEFAQNRSVLLHQELGFRTAWVLQVESVLRRFMAGERRLLADRLGAGRFVDGHGDLRPEHICIGREVRIIDCLEFSRQLRSVDPCDEIAYLAMECERLGAFGAGRYLQRRLLTLLGERPPARLLHFYRCQRAMIRARLALAHLLEPAPRDPKKYRRQAEAYFAIARDSARRLDRTLRTRGGR